MYYIIVSMYVHIYRNYNYEKIVLLKYKLIPFRDYSRYFAAINP